MMFLAARTHPLLMASLALALCCAGSLAKRERDRSEAVNQAIEERKTKTDNLRNALRYLAQMTPSNRQQAAKEVQVELNTWLATADRTRANYSPSPLLQSLPSDLLKVVE